MTEIVIGSDITGGECGMCVQCPDSEVRRIFRSHVSNFGNRKDTGKLIVLVWHLVQKPHDELAPAGEAVCAREGVLPTATRLASKNSPLLIDATILLSAVKAARSKTEATA